MGQCESCVNSSKTAKGGQGISYGNGKKRHTKTTGGGAGGSRRNSFSTQSHSAGKLELNFIQSCSINYEICSLL